VRLKKIVLGLSAVAAAAALAACSSGTNASGNAPSLAANTGTSTTSQSSRPATSTTTVAPTTTTTTTPPTTTKPPVTTTKPKPATQTAQTAEAGIPCGITSGACIDLSARKIWLLNDGQIVYGPVHAEPGRTGWSTPVGTFHVISKAQHYVSREFNAPMPYAVFFAPGIALHEGSATTPSHGCVHLSLAAAQTFFHDMSIGDTVQIVR
jgi:lipoprotein-anchoring transpeptidase ErfK/SrfK